LESEYEKLDVKNSIFKQGLSEKSIFYGGLITMRLKEKCKVMIGKMKYHETMLLIYLQLYTVSEEKQMVRKHSCPYLGLVVHNG